MPASNVRHKDKYDEWRQTDKGQEVYDSAKAIALDMVKRGFSRYSMQMVIYVVRFHRQLKHGPTDGYKVPNNFVKWMRIEMNREQQIPEGFFRGQQ